MTEIVDASIEVNPNFEVTVIQVGCEKTPILIIDNFSVDNSEVIEYACKEVNFTTQEHNYYPGVRATTPMAYLKKMLTKVNGGIYQIFSVPKDLKLKLRQTNFSLVSRQETDLDVIQTIPHYDSANFHYFSVVHYLSEGEHGGTGIFRHKKTNFETINKKRIEEYNSHVMELLIERKNNDDCRYITSSTDEYELLATVDYKPNRLVIFPSRLLHSGMVNKDTDIDPNPATGRLTTVTFIEYV